MSEMQGMQIMGVLSRRSSLGTRLAWYVW